MQDRKSAANHIAFFFVICRFKLFPMKLTSLLLLITFCSLGGDRFPSPPDSPNRLFFIQRSTNANVVVYDANVIAGKLNAKDPVHTYWYRFGEKGQKEELTAIQRTLAYGLYTSAVTGIPNTYEGHFLAYRKRKFMVKQDATGDPIALFPINGKMQILKRVFVSVDDSKFMTTVNYIELFGKDPVTGRDVYEKFKP
ncbi:DUF4833 domain-containing protein [Aquirufa antheringensis]|nr:DUF4833 domain-containing protein [Aquirufa antheringensis]